MTRREREIASLIGQGKTNWEIADNLGISLNTLNRHRSNIRQKNGIRDDAMFYRLCLMVADNQQAKSGFGQGSISQMNYDYSENLHFIDASDVENGTLKILLVSNDPKNINKYVSALNNDYDIIVAEDGYKGAKIVLNEPQLDLIISEGVISEINSYKLLAVAKTNKKTRNTPFIFISESQDDEDEEILLQCGVVDFIRHPIKEGILRAKVKNHLELKKLRDEMEQQKEILSLELNRRLNEIAHLQYHSLNALTELAKARDNETGEHLIRTREYVRILAEELLVKNYYTEELDSESIALITRSAPLHDIGKVGIPDRILLKPGKLTSEEFEIMKLHPIKGYEALQMAELRSPMPIPYIRYAKEITRCHHEKWN